MTLGPVRHRPMPTCVTCILQILTVAHSLGYINRDVRPDNMLVDGDSGVIYLVDWGNAVRRFGTALPCDGTVQFWQHAFRISTCLSTAKLNPKPEMMRITGLQCTAFSLCHPAWQAQLCGISKLQAKEWWRHTVWQQRSCWQEAGQNDYEGIALRLQKLM
ncbi:TPA: Rho-associated protein kinase 2 [Trebouxia sp. C0004]